MTHPDRRRVFTPMLSLLALAGALFGVVSLAQPDPSDDGVELVLNLSHSTGSSGGSPVPAP